MINRAVLACHPALAFATVAFSAVASVRTTPLAFYPISESGFHSGLPHRKSALIDLKESLILGIVRVYPGIPGYEEGRIGRKLNIRMLQRGVVIGRHYLDMAMLT
jgi:hypothetical protein